MAQIPLSEFALWEKLAARRTPLDFGLEITARCNNACRHCYIALPAADLVAKRKELSLDQVLDIADQAVDLGVVWCLITGGEPLLRADFAEVYLGLKRKGLLLSLFTNACLVTDEHEIITLIDGAEAVEADTARIEAWVAEHYPTVEIEAHHGGQPLYAYYIGIE